MLEAIIGRIKRPQSQYDVGLDKARGHLLTARKDFMDEAMRQLREKDLSVVMVEHQSPPNPAVPLDMQLPYVTWAIHYGLKPVKNIEEIKALPWWERRRVSNVWTSRAVGLSADEGGVREVLYSTIKNGSGTWVDVGSNLEYVEWYLSKGLKSSEVPIPQALNHAISLAVPLGDFRFGAGYRGIDGKPRKSKNWRILD